MRLLKPAMQSVRWVFNSGKWNPSKDEWVRAAQCLQKEEKERIGKFVFKKDAKSSMIGRLMLRRLIHRMTSIPYPDIQLARTDKGKPYLVNELPNTCRKLSFNVSHHGDLVVLAAETRCEVGVDVMKLETPVGAKSIGEFFRTMKRQFTEDEWRHITSSGSEMTQLNTFYRLWCLKESYVKTLGIGMGFAVKRLNFHLHDKLTTTSTEAISSAPTGDSSSASTQAINSTTLQVDEDAVTDWCFQETLHDNHCIAVAMVTEPHSPVAKEATQVFSSLPIENLICDSNPLTEADEDYGQTFIHKSESPWSNKAKR